MGGVGQVSASRRAGEGERERERMWGSEGLVVVVVFGFGFGFGSVFVSAGAQVVRGRRREDSDVNIVAMLRGLRICILDEVPGAHCIQRYM